MRLLTQDLAHFFAYRKYASSTHSRYKKITHKFVMYLSQQLAIPPDGIDLNLIVKVVDVNGNTILVRPINANVIDTYFQYLFNIGKESAIIPSRNVLVSFFLHLERNYNFKSPMRELTFDFKCITVKKRPGAVLSRHEILKLLNAIVTNSSELNRDLLLFCLLLSTGRRISEIISLKAGQFDFDFNLYKLNQTKSNRQIIVPMLPGMGTVIEAYCAEKKILPEENLFQVNGNPITYDQVKALFLRYCHLAKIKKISPHDTRRTFATILYEEGVDITTLQQLLSHLRTNTTQRYVYGNSLRNIGLRLEFNQKLYETFKELSQN